MLGPAKESWLVPEVAIGFDQLGPYVLVVGAKNVVERRQVKEGTRSGTKG